MNRESLLNTLETAPGNATDVYFGLYTDYFENGDEPEEALRIILEYPDNIGDTKDRNPRNISRQDENRLICIYEEIISGTANRIMEMNLAKEDFYKKLYSVIFDSDNELFPQNKKEKVIALKILSESVNAVPYYQVIKTDRISRDEFREGIEKLRPSLQEAHYMLHHQFDTTPEEAAQILRIADSISDRKEQVIFWTVILNNLRKDNDED